MKRLLYTLLCLSIFGTVTGCSVDTARSRPSSGAVGVQTYAPDPYTSSASKDGWVYQRSERPFR